MSWQNFKASWSSGIKSTTGSKFSEERLMKTRELSGRLTDTPSLCKAIASTKGCLSKRVRQRSLSRCRRWTESISYDRAPQESTRAKSSNLGCSARLMNSCAAASILSVGVRCHGIITLWKTDGRNPLRKSSLIRLIRILEKSDIGVRRKPNFTHFTSVISKCLFYFPNLIITSCLHYFIRFFPFIRKSCDFTASIQWDNRYLVKHNTYQRVPR